MLRVAGNPSRAHAHAFGAAASPTGSAVVRVIVSDLTVYAHDRASLAGCVAARDGDGRRIWPPRTRSTSLRPCSGGRIAGTGAA